jgi:hypothetical protein
MSPPPYCSRDPPSPRLAGNGDGTKFAGIGIEGLYR